MPVQRYYTLRNMQRHKFSNKQCQLKIKGGLIVSSHEKKQNKNKDIEVTVDPLIINFDSQAQGQLQAQLEAQRELQAQFEAQEQEQAQFQAQLQAQLQKIIDVLADLD